MNRTIYFVNNRKNVGRVSDVSVSSRVNKYLRIINSGVSNFIPEKSERHSYTETLVCSQY
jgi:hypothetical protein